MIQPLRINGLPLDREIKLQKTTNKTQINFKKQYSIFQTSISELEERTFPGLVGTKSIKVCNKIMQNTIAIVRDRF